MGTSNMTDDNSRATMAVLANELKNINLKLDSLIESQNVLDKVLTEHSVRLEGLGGQLATQCQRLDGRVDRTADESAKQIQRLDGRMDRAEDKIKGWSIGQTSLTVIAASIAAWLGIRQ